MTFTLGEHFLVKKVVKEIFSESEEINEIYYHTGGLCMKCEKD